jgi:DNA-binding XRE family transcriptional regulator
MPRAAATDEQQQVMIRLAGTLRMLRETEHMSIREFAKKIGIDASGLFRLENGTNPNPSIFLIRKLATAFDLTIDELMNFDATPCPTCGGRGWVKGEGADLKGEYTCTECGHHDEFPRGQKMIRCGGCGRSIFLVRINPEGDPSNPSDVGN